MYFFSERPERANKLISAGRSVNEKYEMTENFKKNRRVIIVAELSANHGNNLDLAIRTIQGAAKAGADAIKVQTFKPESLTLDIENEYFDL